MSLYHVSFKIIGRSKGKSAIASAAYRSGSKLYSEEADKSFNYGKKGGVIHSEIILCENAPEAYKDRETLWNAVQAKEKNSNAQLAREVEVALPVEFERELQKEVVRKYIKDNFTSKGMIADWALHDKGDGNPHAHIMLTTRPIKANGEWGEKEKKGYKQDERGFKIPQLDMEKVNAWETENGEKLPRKKAGTGEEEIDIIEFTKGLNEKEYLEAIKPFQKMRVRKGKGEERLWERGLVQANDWNRKENVLMWRKSWEDICNEHLTPDKQIDCRSYKERGIDKIPTVHIGAAAQRMEDNGEKSERVQLNRDIERYNKATELRGEINEFRKIREGIQGETRSYTGKITECGRIRGEVEDTLERVGGLRERNKSLTRRFRELYERVRDRLVEQLRKRVIEPTRTARTPTEPLKPQEGINTPLDNKNPVQANIEYYKQYKSDKAAGLYDYTQEGYFEIIRQGYMWRYPYNMPFSEYDELIDEWETLEKTYKPYRDKITAFNELQARKDTLEAQLQTVKGKDKREIKAELKEINKDLPAAKKAAEGAKTWIIEPNPAQVLERLRRYKLVKAKAEEKAQNILKRAEPKPPTVTVDRNEDYLYNPKR